MTTTQSFRDPENPHACVHGDVNCEDCMDRWSAEERLLRARVAELEGALQGMVTLYDQPIPHEGDHEVAAVARAALATKPGGGK